MKSARVIIGANLGDEGKGLLTDYYAAPHGENALVVRFNGGAQAGHTVVTPEGTRHVFSHFGSGTLAGARTFLSKFFVLNPTLFLKERADLIKKGVKPVVYADPRSLVTTPYDMMLNQMLERSRGDSRHGSVGIGFGETIQRCDIGYDIGVLTTYRLLMMPRLYREALREIRDCYMPKRLAELGIVPDESEREFFSSDRVIDQTLHEAEQFLIDCELADLGDFKTSEIIFEGAQGLLLDQDHEWFPHVTRSSTGLKNVLAIVENLSSTPGFLNIDHLDITYVTRTYLTRHGAGPLPNELGRIPYERVQDETNLPHPFQGTLRFAYLDTNRLARTVAADLMLANQSGLSYSHEVAMTCMDQVGGEIRIHVDKEFGIPEEKFPRVMQVCLFDNHSQRLPGILVSTGRTRQDISSPIPL